ncbi:MAG: hypothetical protein GY851_08995 [bacterium]|nr:hypothetical protein [bacterium]
MLEELLLDAGLMAIGNVGACAVRIIHSMGLVETALERLRFDPFYLTVDRTKDR